MEFNELMEFLAKIIPAMGKTNDRISIEMNQFDKYVVTLGIEK